MGQVGNPVPPVFVGHHALLRLALVPVLVAAPG
jgi:hypothetical protein